MWFSKNCHIQETTLKYFISYNYHDLSQEIVIVLHIICLNDMPYVHKKILKNEKFLD